MSGGGLLGDTARKSPSTTESRSMPPSFAFVRTIHAEAIASGISSVPNLAISRCCPQTYGRSPAAGVRLPRSVSITVALAAKDPAAPAPTALLSGGRGGAPEPPQAFARLVSDLVIWCGVEAAPHRRAEADPQ